MALLVDTLTAPPGGWRYVQPETGCEFNYGSLVETIERVIQHRRYKELTPVDEASVSRDIQRQICSGMEPRFCRAEPGEDYRPTVDLPGTISLKTALAFSAAMFEWVKGGSQLVSKEESERRAAICRGCRFNRHADTCGACAAFYAAVGAVVPKARAEAGLKICGACGCSLQAKVLLPKAAIDASNAGRGIIYPAHCWQRET